MLRYYVFLLFMLFEDVFFDGFENLKMTFVTRILKKIYNELKYGNYRHFYLSK